MKVSNAVALLFFAAAISTSAAQPPPAGLSFSADLARYYFASPEAEVAARANLDSALERLDKFKGRIDTGVALLETLQSYEDVLRIYRLHEGYLRLRCSQNRQDVACEANEKLGSEVSARTSFLNPEILAIPNARLQAFMTASPQLNAATGDYMGL